MSEKSPRTATDELFDTEEYIRLLSLHTEAGTALVTAGVVEDWLQKLLLTFTRPISNQVAGKMYDGYGPLSTFSAKIDVAYLFKLFDEEIYNDLRAIKSVRNRFAHTTQHVYFTSDEVARECQRLTGWSKDANNKALYERRCAACIGYIKGRIDREIFDQAIRPDPDK